MTAIPPNNRDAPEGSSQKQEISNLESSIERDSADTIPVALPPSQAQERSLLTSIGRGWIGPYRLLSLIDEGGMGTVWLAEQREPIYRKVAIKAIKTDHLDKAGSRHVLARFEIERQVLAMMDHQNIAKIFDAGHSPTHGPYFVMEYCRGSSLIDFCERSEQNLEQRLQLFVQICLAVEHAHQKGVIHRDLKPNNILVSGNPSNPIAKVIDFGLAKAVQPVLRLSTRTVHTKVGDILGTIKYMSPEQAGLDTEDVDTRSDIYSLGVILFELLTGMTPVDLHPIKEMALPDIIRIIREVDPQRPSEVRSIEPSIGANTPEPKKTILSGTGKKYVQKLRNELDWIVMKALEKDRERRYQTVSSFREDLVRFLSSEPIDARPPSTLYRFRKFTSRRKGLVATLASSVGAMIVCVLGITYGLMQKVSKNDALTKTNITLVKIVGDLDGAKKQLELQAQTLEEKIIALDQSEKLQTRLMQDASADAVKLAVQYWADSDLSASLLELCKAIDLNPQNEKAVGWLYNLLSDRPNFFWSIPDAIIGGNEKTKAVIVSRDGRFAAIVNPDSSIQLVSVKSILNGIESSTSRIPPIQIPGASRIYDFFMDKETGCILFLVDSSKRSTPTSVLEVWSFDIEDNTVSKMSEYSPTWRFFVPPFFVPGGKCFIARGGRDIQNPMKLNYAVVSVNDGQPLKEFENINHQKSFAVSSDGNQVIADVGNQIQLYDVVGRYTRVLKPEGISLGDVGFELLGSNTQSGLEIYQVVVPYTEQIEQTYTVSVPRPANSGERESASVPYETRTRVTNVLRTAIETQTRTVNLIDTRKQQIPFYRSQQGKHHLFKVDDELKSTDGIPFVDSISTRTAFFNASYGGNYPSEQSAISLMERRGKNYLIVRQPEISEIFALPEPLDGYLNADFFPQYSSSIPSSPFIEFHGDRRLDFAYNAQEDLLLSPISLSETHVYKANSAIPYRLQTSDRLPDWHNVPVKHEPNQAIISFAEMFDACESFTLIDVDFRGFRSMKKIPLTGMMKAPRQIFVAQGARKVVSSSYEPIVSPNTCTNCGSTSDHFATNTETSLEGESVMHSSIRVPESLDSETPFSESIDGVSDSELMDSREQFLINDLDNGNVVAGPFSGIVCGVDYETSRVLVRFNRGIKIYDLFALAWRPETLVFDTEVTAAALSIDGEKIAVGRQDGNLDIFDAFSLSKLATHTFLSGVNSIEFSPNNLSMAVSVDMALPIQGSRNDLDKATQLHIIDLHMGRIHVGAPVTAKFLGYSNDGASMLLADRVGERYEVFVSDALSREVIFGPISPPQSEHGLLASFISDDLIAISSGSRTQLFWIGNGYPATPAFIHPDLDFVNGQGSWALPRAKGIVTDEQVTLVFESRPGIRSWIVKLPLRSDLLKDLDSIEKVKEWTRYFATTCRAGEANSDMQAYFSERLKILREPFAAEQWEILRKWLIDGAQSERPWPEDFSGNDIQLLPQANMHLLRNRKFYEEERPVAPSAEEASATGN